MKGEKRICAAIVTTEPNDFFGRYHARQVCALSDTKEMDAWMDETSQDKALKLLHPPRDDEWEAVPVEDRVFKHGRIEMEDLVPSGKPERHAA
jgi:putative SOS response-associated peptidase YedK